MSDLRKYNPLARNFVRYIAGGTGTVGVFSEDVLVLLVSVIMCAVTEFLYLHSKKHGGPT